MFVISAPLRASNKALAQEPVAGMPGVTGVDNQLATKVDVAATNTDAWIHRKEEFALLFHRNVLQGLSSVKNSMKNEEAMDK